MATGFIKRKRWFLIGIAASLLLWFIFGFILPRYDVIVIISYIFLSTAFAFAYAMVVWQPAPPVIPAKTRPATPAETQAAHTHMKLAHRFLVQAYDSQKFTDIAMTALSHASRALNTARMMDPAAKVIVEQEKQQVEHSVDSLAAQILTGQGDILMYGAYLLNHTSSSSDEIRQIKSDARTAQGYARDAIAAGNAALAYDRYTVKPYLILAKAYAFTSNMSAARKAIQDAERLDPHNLDVLELKAKIR